MENLMAAAGNYLISVLTTTISQLFILLGPGIILAVIMYFISGFVQDRAGKVLGARFFIYFTAPGTAVHELGHALFALLFGHQITEINLFGPRLDGTIGYVGHRWNRESIYQNVGRFFIGIGPVILGSIVIYLAARFTVGNQVFQPLSSLQISAQTLSSWENVWDFCLQVYRNSLQVMGLLFSPANLKNAWFFPFLYIVFAVGSHVKLSPPDLEGAWSGFFFLFAAFLIFNFLTIWFGDFATKYIALVSQSYSFFYATMLFTIVLLLIFLALILVISLIKRLFQS